MDDFELALDDCLQRLTAGRSSLGQCLGRYPQYAAELRPLLETALRLQQGKVVRPAGAARDRARSKVNAFVQSHPRQPRDGNLIPRLTFIMLALVLASLVVSTAFAQGALPGQMLYGWKLSAERAWRLTAPDPVAVDLTLADRRADEILMLASNQTHAARDDEQKVMAESEGISAYKDVIGRLASEAKGPDEAHLLKVLEAHQQKFSHAGIHVPELDNIVSHAQSGNSQGSNGHKP